ncbi:hypothetical protein DM2_2081 [Halorubrum sp. DM2]|nr:hypothetical protein DM2_2081 [Halorubrum sp. DM2]
MTAIDARGLRCCSWFGVEGVSTPHRCRVPPSALRPAPVPAAVVKAFTPAGAGRVCDCVPPSRNTNVGAGSATRRSTR